MKKPELLAPAGNIEKLKIACKYGADAVYLAGKKYGLRAGADNFTIDEMEEGIEFAHKLGKKVYVAVNIIPHDEDFEGLQEYTKELQKIGADAVIVSDPGVLSLVKETAPKMRIHLSTQANNVNVKSAMFWQKMGVNRVVLARELSIKEIKSIIKNSSEAVEYECFVHGAMCISYSGRCLLSNYMINRDSNKGDCAQSCRWEYNLMEEKRPGEYFPVYEDENGTYIFNSKDLCLIRHTLELIESGLGSFKIEGRMKSNYYVALVTSIYRQAIDSYFKNPAKYKFDEKLMDELKKISHRQHSEGFLFSKPGADSHIYEGSGYVKPYDYAGFILDYNKKTKIAKIEQQNTISVGDEIEIIGPFRDYYTQIVKEMWDSKENIIETANHPQEIVSLRVEKQVNPMDIIRKKV
ncbi:U32 family peptidase [Elusimicrobiota bacterium]